MSQILEFYAKGNCQVVLQDKDKNYVYKIPYDPKYQSANGAKGMVALAKGRVNWLRGLIERQKRRKQFTQSIGVLKKLQSLTGGKLEQFLPITDIVQARKVLLKIMGREFVYTGNMIKQQYVSPFFTNTVPSLKSFDWKNIVEVQIGLWKCGVGIGAAADAWGPKNWGRCSNGTVRLVDVSHLTEDRNVVANRITSDTMEKRKRKLLSYPEVHSPSDVEEYFQFMQEHLNSKNLNRHWGTWGISKT